MFRTGKRSIARVIAASALVAVLGAGFAAAPVAISSPAHAQGAKKHPGKKLYLRRTCMACHGKGGSKAIQDYPNIAGQDKKYMIDQIEDILSGKRTGSPDATGNPRAEGMRGALVTAEGTLRVTADEIKEIVDWLVDQPVAAPKPLDPPITEEQIAAGEKAYKKGKCQTCHGKEGLKPLKGYPIIAGQKRSYIVAQMTDIRDGHRKNGKSKLMLSFVKKMDDATIGTLADYLSQIDRTAN
ncbi:MAG: hypothetical protein C0606_06170 [Hyphomicrobiales bacterium]|nr:MAG: hypothetical protein C0606_06170 [Hyphomicrobiales bacterium]